MARDRHNRLTLALHGMQATPLVAGMTFVPPDVLASVVPGCGSPGECLLATASSLDLDFVFVPAVAEWAVPVVEARAGCGLMWVVDGPMWQVIGTEDAGAGLRRTVSDPDSLAPLLDAETERAAAEVQRGLELGVDAIVIAEDLAGTDRLLVTPGFAAEHVLPRLAVLASRAVGEVPVALHSDGDIRALLPDLRKAGFSAIHAGGGLERDTFEELFWAARRNNLTVIGGIRTPPLGRGANAAMRAGTHAALLAQAGGLVIADDGGISTPAEMAAFGTALGAARSGAAGATARG